MPKHDTHDLRGEDVIDSRDVEARISELEDLIESQFNDWWKDYREKADLPEDSEEEEELHRDAFNRENDSTEAEELKILRQLKEDCGSAEWQYGLGLIRDSYFEDYARQEAVDIGLISDDAKWPCTCIDWERAAKELQTDYSSVEFDGETYWYRD